LCCLDLEMRLRGEVLRDESGRTRCSIPERFVTNSRDSTEWFGCDSAAWSVVYNIAAASRNGVLEDDLSTVGVSRRVENRSGVR
jgi:hypothetical protein